MRKSRRGSAFVKKFFSPPHKSHVLSSKPRWAGDFGEIRGEEDRY